MPEQVVFSVTVPSGTTVTAMGYQLIDYRGAPYGKRVSAGIERLSTEEYRAAVRLPRGFRGALLWDSGGSAPLYAAEEINPIGAENGTGRHTSRCCLVNAPPGLHITEVGYQLLAADGSPVSPRVTKGIRRLADGAAYMVDLAAENLPDGCAAIRWDTGGAFPITVDERIGEV